MLFCNEHGYISTTKNGMCFFKILVVFRYDFKSGARNMLYFYTLLKSVMHHHDAFLLNHFGRLNVNNGLNNTAQAVPSE